MVCSYPSRHTVWIGSIFRKYSWTSTWLHQLASYLYSAVCFFLYIPPLGTQGSHNTSLFTLWLQIWSLGWFCTTASSYMQTLPLSKEDKVLTVPSLPERPSLGTITAFTVSWLLLLPVCFTHLSIQPQELLLYISLIFLTQRVKCSFTASSQFIVIHQDCTLLKHWFGLPQ